MPIWTDAVTNAIRRHVARTGSPLFTRQALIAAEGGAMRAETRTRGQTPTQTMGRELQQLRDGGLLEFLGPGSYRWLGAMPEFETATPSKGVFLLPAHPLQKWFLATGLLVNSKKSVSSCQLARDLDMNQKSAWYMQQRIRAAMLTDEGELLQGIVEVDETYVGGKPRRRNNRDDKSGGGGFTGRGTKKTPVVGAVERGGRVVARVASDGVGGKALGKFIASAVDRFGTLVVTDEWAGYSRLHQTMQHAVVRHKREYAVGMVHTNTIEGFWSLVKRAWYGTHHNYSKRYMPLFIGEACWKYNHRKIADPFSSFMKGCFA